MGLTRIDSKPLDGLIFLFFLKKFMHPPYIFATNLNVEIFISFVEVEEDLAQYNIPSEYKILQLI